MERLEVILDSLDIENALREYCENVLNMKFTGMNVTIENSDNGTFPEECKLVAYKLVKE